MPTREWVRDADREDGADTATLCDTYLYPLHYLEVSPIIPEQGWRAWFIQHFERDSLIFGIYNALNDVGTSDIDGVEILSSYMSWMGSIRNPNDFSELSNEYVFVRDIRDMYRARILSSSSHSDEDISIDNQVRTHTSSSNEDGYTTFSIVPRVVPSTSSCPRPRRSTNSDRYVPNEYPLDAESDECDMPIVDPLSPQNPQHRPGVSLDRARRERERMSGISVRDGSGDSIVDSDGVIMNPPLRPYGSPGSTRQRIDRPRIANIQRLYYGNYETVEHTLNEESEGRGEHAMPSSRDVFIEKIIDATKSFAELNDGIFKVTPTSPTDKKERAIVSVVSDMGFADKEGKKRILVLCEILTDKKPGSLSKYIRGNNDGRVKFNKLCAIIPTGNRNNHNYPIGNICICVETHESRFVFSDAFGEYSNNIHMGNSMDNHPLSCKPATDEEIEKFVSELNDRQFANLVDQLGMIMV